MGPVPRRSWAQQSHFTEEKAESKEAEVSEPDGAEPGHVGCSGADWWGEPVWQRLPAQLLSLVPAGLPGTGPGEGSGPTSGGGCVAVAAAGARTEGKGEPRALGKTASS